MRQYRQAIYGPTPLNRLSALIRQLLIENIVLAVSGGLLGIGLSLKVMREYTGSRLWFAGSLPREANIQLDLRVLLFALSISVLSGIVFGLVPSVHRISI